MKVTADTKRQLLQLVTVLVVFCAIAPGHKPWLSGWTVLVGGALGGFLLLGILTAVVGGLYGALRKSLVHQAIQEHEARPHLQGDEVAIVVCLTLLAVIAVWFLYDIGVFTAMSGSADSDPSPLR